MEWNELDWIGLDLDKFPFLFNKICMLLPHAKIRLRAEMDFGAHIKRPSTSSLPQIPLPSLRESFGIEIVKNSIKSDSIPVKYLYHPGIIPADPGAT